MVAAFELHECTLRAVAIPCQPSEEILRQLRVAGLQRLGMHPDKPEGGLIEQFNPRSRLAVILTRAFQYSLVRLLQFETGSRRSHANRRITWIARSHGKRTINESCNVYPLFF